MAAINSRRRAVTYGKTSRKPITSLSPAAADAFSRIAFTDEIRNIGDLDFPEGLKKHVSRATSPKTKADSIQENAYTRSPSIAAKQRRAVSTPEEWDSIYDIPSSDEESRQLSSVRGVMGRKRRKITPEVKTEGYITVHDHVIQKPFNTVQKSKIRESDAHLPRDPSTPVSKHLHTKRATGKSHMRKLSGKSQTGRKSPKCRNSPETSILRTPDNSKETTATASYESPGSSLGSPKKLLGSVLPCNMEQRREAPRMANSSMKEYVFVSQQHDDSEPAVSSARSEQFLGSNPEQRFAGTPASPKTPPRRSRPTSGVTTPHQQSLWSMLLSESGYSNSPSNLDLPGLRLVDGKAQNRPSIGDQRIEALHEVVDNARHAKQRRRLVDGLQCRNAARGDAELDLSDQMTAEGCDSGDERALDHVQELIADPALGSQRCFIANSDQSSTIRNQNQKKYSMSQPVQVLPNMGVKATYARQRSYLTEGDIGVAPTFDLPILQDSATGRRLKRESTQDTTKPVDCDIDETRDSQAPALRSIHELRKAGGNSRLLSDIEAMMDDISDESPLSLRRGRLLELTTKLQEASFRQTFTDQGFESRLLTWLKNTDVVESLLIVAAILQLLAEPISTRILCQISSADVVEFLAGLLDTGQDITTTSNSRVLNMSKSAHNELKGFCYRFRTSSVWSTSKPRVVTAQVASLQCLEHLVRQSREAGSVDDVLPPHILSRVTRFLGAPPGIVTPQPPEEPATEFHLAISILESCTIAINDDLDDAMWSGQTLKYVLDLLPSLDTRFIKVSESLRSLILRLYLNLTNNNPVLCEAFSQPDVLRPICDIVVSHFEKVSRDEVTQTLVLDSLILSLGSLINLAEWCESVRESALDLQYRDLSYLDHFLQLFMSNSQKTAEVFSEEETTANVAFGYLSVLISYLCTSERVLTRTRSQLPGGTLDPLLDAVKEFLHFHRRIDEEIYHAPGEMDLKASFTTRLQGIVDVLERTG